MYLGCQLKDNFWFFLQGELKEKQEGHSPQRGQEPAPAYWEASKPRQSAVPFQQYFVTEGYRIQYRYLATTTN